MYKLQPVEIPVHLSTFCHFYQSSGHDQTSGFNQYVLENKTSAHEHLQYKEFFKMSENAGFIK